MNKVLNKFWAGNSCYVLSIIDNTVDFDFLYYYMKSIQSKLTGTQMVGAIPAVNMSFVKDLEIRYPESLEHQKQVAKILADLDELAKLHKSKADTLNKMKSQLMSNKTGIIEQERQKSEIPAGWVKVKLGNICKIENGKLNANEEVENGKYPFFTAKVDSQCFTNTYSYDTEALTIIRKGTPGYVKYYNGKFETSNCCFCLYGFPAHIRVKYLFYYIKSMYSQLKDMAHGVIPGINIKNLSGIEILVPVDLSEQDRIIGILENYDGLIESQSQLMQIVERESSYRENYSQPNQRDSTEWIEITLGELFDTRNGYTPSKAVAEYWEDGTIPWYRMEDIRENGHILYDSIQHIHPSGLKKSGTFPVDSIILATTATIGEHALLKTPALSNQQFTCFTVKDKYKTFVDIDYLYWYFYIIDDWCKANANTGTSFPTVDVQRLKQQKIWIPKDKSEQQRIASILSNYDNLITSQQQLIKIVERERERLQKELLTN